MTLSLENASIFCKTVIQSAHIANGIDETSGPTV